MPDQIKTKLIARFPGGGVRVGDAAIRGLIDRLKEETVSRQGCAWEVCNKYMLLIQGRARKELRIAPVRIDEGTLRSSIQTMITSAFNSRVAALIFTNLEYAVYVHWGTGIFGQNPEGGHRRTPWVYYDKKRKQFVFTRGMEANKFLLNAFYVYRDAFLRELEECLAEG